MRTVAVLGIALAVQTPIEAETVRVNANPAPVVVNFTCIAPRGPLSPKSSEKYKYIVHAIVTGIPRSEEGSVIQRNDLRIIKFVKGRFAPRRVRAYFSYVCGPGGPPFKVGDYLTLYIKLHKGSYRGQAVSVDYWEPWNLENS